MNARSLLALAFAAPSIVLAQSDELFVFDLAETGNPSNTLIVGGSTLPDLASDLADTEGDFASFDGVSFDAMLRYAGVEGAIDISYDPTGGSGGGALLTINNIQGYTGPPIVLDEADGDLGDQLEDFFLKDNPDIIEDFLSAIAEESVVAITDGNPLASTARSAKYRFDRFGLFADISPASNQINRMFVDSNDPGLSEPVEDDVPRMEMGSAVVDHGGFLSRIDFLGQTVEAGDFSGSSFDLTMSTEMRFTDRFSLVFGLPVGYHTIEGADVFNIGLHLDAPINILLVEENADQGFSWTVTPGVSGEAVVSYDFAAGGTLYSFGITNAFRYDYKKLTLIAAQQITWHESAELDVDEYKIDPGIDQQILKLGGKAVYRLTDGAAIYGGATWTDFLEDAAVENYVTPVAGVAWQLKNGANMTVGYEGDFGDDYDAHGGRISFQLPF
ncbi:MAG: hypothetical protein Phyf2KO_23340 [Phycisphaerales bacterium]